MSSLVPDSREDFPAAAARHLDDAVALLRDRRADNAAYLAGYVVECVLKTVLKIELGDQPLSHDLASLSRRASELAALPGAKTVRYAAERSLHPIYDYAGEGWNESLRYRRSGTITAKDAEDWLEEGGRLFDQVIGSLRLDGIVC